jgi:protein phosphatase
MELSQRLRNESKDQIGLKGMGATVVLAMVHGLKVHIAHMGDSRAYLIRKGRLSQLTKDHSIVGILLRHGEITPAEAREHPARGSLSRYVGMEGEVPPDLRTIAMKTDDRLLLCSDGLSGMLTNRTIANIVRKHPDIQIACRTLVDAANAAGGKDNITAVIVAWKDLADR